MISGRKGNPSDVVDNGVIRNSHNQQPGLGVLVIPTLSSRSKLPGHQIEIIAKSLGLIPKQMDMTKAEQQGKRSGTRESDKLVIDSIILQLARLDTPALLGAIGNEGKGTESLDQFKEPDHNNLRAVVPIEGIEEPSKALRKTMGSLSDVGTELIIVHVFDNSTIPSFWEGAGHNDIAWKKEFMLRYCAQRNARLHLRIGKAPLAIVALAEDEDADVIVLEWNGSIEERRSPTIRSLIERSTTPLLIIPSHREAHSQSIGQVAQA